MTIIRFRLGSLISDYVVALRSLTTLTGEQIQEKVRAKIEEIKKSLQNNISGTMAKFNWSSVKGFNSTKVQQQTDGGTTKSTSASSNSALLRNQTQWIFSSFVILILSAL